MDAQMTLQFQANCTGQTCNPGALIKLELDKDSAKDLVKAAGMASRAQAETALTWIRRGFRLRIEKGWNTNGVARKDEPVRTLMLELTGEDIAALELARAAAEHGTDQRAVLLELMFNGSLWEWEGCDEDDCGERFVLDVTATRAAIERQASSPGSLQLPVSALREQSSYETALDDLASFDTAAGFEPIGAVAQRSLREAVQEVKRCEAHEDAA